MHRDADGLRGGLSLGHEQPSEGQSEAGRNLCRLHSAGAKRSCSSTPLSDAPGARDMTRKPMKQKKNGYCAATGRTRLPLRLQEALLSFQNSTNNGSAGNIFPDAGEVTTCSPCSLDSSTHSFIFGDETLPQIS